MSQNPFADPYQSPQPLPYPQLAPGQKPAVWFWYVCYCLAMALLYLLLTGMGLVTVAFGGVESSDSYVVGTIFIIFCLPFALLFGAAPFLPPTKLAWIYGFVTIGLGLTSCCTLPICIPLLLQWIKPEVRAYFKAL